MSDELISREGAIDALADYIHNVDKVMGTGHLTADDCKDAAASVFEELPSAQQEQRGIPVKTRPMDEEERKEWSGKVGYELEGDDAVIYTSQLPEDGQECIVCTKWGNVFIDTFQNDPDYGCVFEDHGDMDGITAWMPLPKPWKGEKDE